MNKFTHTVVTLVATTFFLITAISLTGCDKSLKDTDRVVIWTSCSEFAQYIELFNKTHKDTKALLVYKKNPAEALPPAKDELPPDLIVGSWLYTDSAKKNFKSLDYLFDRKQISSTDFYEQLIEAGKYKHQQVLLPVSFNLPAIIFDSSNKNLMPDSYTLSLEQIKTAAIGYNQKKASGAFSKIGFTPLSNDDFLYLTTKINGVVKKTFTELDNFFCSAKSYGGTEKVINDKYVIEDTMQIETWYRPDIVSGCRIKLLDDNSEWEILNTPEDIDRRHQFLVFKVKRIVGGA